MLYKKDFFIKVLFSVWFFGIGVGLYQLWSYMNTPGELGEIPYFWPESSQIEFQDKAKLVIFVHPHCPCSRASLNELSRILPHNQEKIDVHIIFYHPSKFDLNWVHSDLWEIAKTFPKTTLHIDSKSHEIKTFSPKTSGQVYLFSRDKELLYVGGITNSRGHEGTSIGKDAIINWLKEGKKPPQKSFVFGCSLFHSGEKEILEKS